MHILFLADNFPPETNAPASRTFEHARRWVRAGARVTVVTTAPNFPAGKIFSGYRNRLFQREWLDGVETIRVWTYITANEGFVRRTLDYMSFMVTGFLAGLFLPRPDIVVSTSPQFFTACAAFVLSRVKRRPYVFELRDLWPDSIVAVGAMREGGVIRLLRKLEYFLYRKAARVVSVTHSFKKVLVGNGIPQEHVEVVPNGAELQTYRPGEKPHMLAARLGLDGKFVAAYVGTVGMAHGLQTLLAAAEHLRERNNIRIVVVGTGAEHEMLVGDARRRSLDNVVFTGAVSKTDVRDYWRLCDVALVLLRDHPLFSHVIPSKMFEAMSTGRAVVLGVRGESRALLDAAAAGIAIEPEDAAALARAISDLADDPVRCRNLGAAGRRFVETHYNRDILAMKMLAILGVTAAGK